MHRVRIESNGSKQYGAKVFVDDQRIEKLEGVNFSFSWDSKPEITISTRGVPDIDVLADVKLDPSPQNIHVACQIIEYELRKHGDLYDGFVASIISALKETGFAEDIRDVADRTLNRIIGEE